VVATASSMNDILAIINTVNGSVLDDDLYGETWNNTLTSMVMREILRHQLPILVMDLVKSSYSQAGEHPDFQVTQCLQNDSTDVDFAYIKSE
jgi:hypothetical protein